MIDFTIFLMLFVISVWLGTIISSTRKPKCTCEIRDTTIIIYYGKRILYVVGDLKVRLPSYTRTKNVENIVIPLGRGIETAQQVESFFRSSVNTSILSKRLFNFSARAHPILLMQYDPACAKELVEIQAKLNAFVRMK